MNPDMGRDFNPDDYWKAIILYGLNAATYKMALAKCLLSFAKNAKTVISWGELAEAFYFQYKQRLADYPMPQQSNPGRLT
ncbi:MAG: HNH endonuclease, partial [Dehalococcoidia bacterium]|nr:HNH endonuclease [Dehalococcoidia bacterium]